MEIDGPSENYNEELNYEQIKQKMLQIFINFCDFSLETGDIFLKQLTFVKLLKESNVIPMCGTQNDINILISKELRTSTLTNLTFDQFLNLIVSIIKRKNLYDFDLQPKFAI